MDELILDPDALSNIADILDGYCAKQREIVNVFYAQIMALESEWRDDETFGSLVEELDSLRAQAISILDEVYETYPKYFRQRAQQILERPVYRAEPLIITAPATAAGSHPMSASKGRTEYSSIAEYYNAHQYMIGDYDIYSKDPVWRALMRKEHPNTKLPAYSSLDEYFQAHGYSQEDVDKFSNDPDWQQVMANSVHENIATYLQKTDYISVEKCDSIRTSEEIVSELGGGDCTSGSCSSLAFAYAGNKGGYKVLDFRDGESRKFFSENENIQVIADMPGIESKTIFGKNDIECAQQLLSQMESNKEYYLATGEHAAIVRKGKTNFEYLELQSPNDNGWHELTPEKLHDRFGCEQIRNNDLPNFLIDVNSMANCKNFIYVLGYINTAESKQRKGELGDVK